MNSVEPTASPAELTQSIHAEQQAFLQGLEAELATFFDQQEETLLSVSEEALPLLEAIRDLSSGGKRLRALLCYWGWRGAGGAADSELIFKAAAALELFQSAALIHDDIIDRSQTRRGAPAVHKQFEIMHRKAQWRSASSLYGSSSAIIAGDLCLSWSEMLLASIGQLASSAYQVRSIFDLMRTEVMAGQYLDILGEVIATEEYGSALGRAHHVIRYKSAKYSCEHPLVLGGALALETPRGVCESLLEAYRAFALPLGEGYQLRDDVLGVFGQPAKTGKPAGDDLKEGKRTVLIALTQKNANPKQWQRLDEALGNKDLSEGEIAELCKIIVDSGALADVEAVIAETGNIVSSALLELKVAPLVKEALAKIAAAALHRSA